MKKKPLLFCVVAVVVFCTASTGFHRWRDVQLRTPTAEQISEALPDKAQTVFDGADKFTLYSLRPLGWPTVQSEPQQFHGFYILGQTEINDAKAMNELRKAYYDGIAVGPETMRAACFDPRHGIRAEKNGVTVDLLICFQCSQSKAFVDGKEYETARINQRPQETFNRIYTAAGLTLEPLPHHGE